MKTKITFKESIGWQFLGMLHRSTLSLSYWLVIITFIEVHMWISVNPATMNLQIGIFVFLCSACITPTLLSFKAIRLHKPKLLIKLILQLAPTILLIAAGLPTHYKNSLYRIFLLGLALALLPLTLPYVFSKPPTGFPGSQYSFRFVTNPIIKNGINKNFAELFFLLAVIINACIRYLTLSINVFYENWSYSLILFFLILHKAFVYWLVDNQFCTNSQKQYLQKHRGFSLNATKILLEFEETENADGNSDKNGKSSKTKERSSIVQNKTKVNSSTSSPLRSIASAESSQVRFKCPVIKSDETVDVSFSEGLFQLRLFISSCINGYTTGMLIVLFLWFFSTPYLLVQWSLGGNAQPAMGKYVLCALTAGFYFCLFFSPDKLCLFIYRRTSTYRMMASLTFLCLFCTLVALLVLGSYLFIKAKNFLAFVGSLILCLVLPYVLSVNIHSMYWICSLANSGVNNQKIVEIFPGIFCCLAIVGFLISYLTFLHFNFAWQSSILLGRMDIILLIVTCIISLSFASFISLFYAVKKGLLVWFQQDLDVGSKSTRVKLHNALSKHRHSLILFMFPLLFVILAISIGPYYPISSRFCLAFHSRQLKNISDASDQFNASAKSDLTIVAWNIRFGHDLYGKGNVQCVTKIIKIINPSIVGLQKTDGLAPFWGGKDILGFISGLAKIDYYSGVEPLKGTAGVGILTSLNVTDQKSYILPQEFETDPFLNSFMQLDLMINNQYLRIVNVQAVLKDFSSINTTKAAMTQSKQLEFILKKINAYNSNLSTILMGDFNLNSNNPAFDKLYQAGFNVSLHNEEIMPSVKSNFRHSSCIFFKGIKLLFSRVLTETEAISDHYPTLAKFKFPS